MKVANIISVISLVVSSLGFADTHAEKTFLPLDKAYAIENGFDRNDSIEVAVTGYLPDTCHKLGKGTAFVDHVNKQILVNVEGYVRNQDTCLEVITPFLEVIQVGQLDVGKYEVISIINPEVKGSLNIKESPSEDQDDHLYAPVDTVEIVASSEKQNEVVLKGTYPHMINGCMRMEEVRTYVTSNNILVVQPIAKILSVDECRTSDTEVHNRFKVNQPLDVLLPTKTLVHVRTTMGRAVNHLVDHSMP